MKKTNVLILILVVAFILGIGSFTGCNSNQSDPNDDSVVKVKDLEEVTLKFYFIGEEPVNSRDILNAVENKTKDTLNVKLDFQWLTGTNKNDLLQKIHTMFESGDQFDAIQIGRDGTFDAIYDLYKKGWLLDVSKMLPNYAPELYGIYSEDELANASYDGKIVLIPSHYPRCYRMCVAAREDIIKKYNISDIQTYDDYEKFLQIVKGKESNIIPGCLTENSLALFSDLYGYVRFGYGLVYRWNDPKIKLIPWEKTNEFKSAIDTIKKWNEKGYVSNSLDLINTGSLVSFVAGWDAVKQYISSITNNIKYKIYPLYPDKKTQMLTDVIGISINKNAANPERTLMFLNWIQANQNNYDLFMYGIKGENYDINVQGKITFPEDGKSHNQWYGSYSFINFNYLHPTVSEPDNFKEEYMKVVNLSSDYPPATGFIADTQKIQPQIDKRMANISEFEQNIKKGIFTESTEEFIKKQEDAQVDILVTTIQKQLNNWIVK